LSAEEPARPGLAEALVVWALLAVVALAVWVTYTRLPVNEVYNVSHTGFVPAAGRVLVYLNYPVALVAIGILAILAGRLPGRLALVTVPAAILCAVVAWPGVVEQSNLDAKPINAVPALGVAIAFVLTISVLAGGGVGASRRFGGGWDAARAGLAVALVFGSIPWIFSDLGAYVGHVPGLGDLFMSNELQPEPGHPDLRAVHLGHHHGLDGTLFALSALTLSRVVVDIRGRYLREALGFYVALMLVYGLANALQDFWLEQLYKRGTTSLRLPTMNVPTISWAWLGILVAAVLIYFLARFVVKGGPTRQEGAQ
jgi:hypothetical protein